MLIKIFNYRLKSYKVPSGITYSFIVNVIKKRYVFHKAGSSKSSLKDLNYLENKEKVGSIHISCTKRNIFCTLTDIVSKEVKSSCSLRVPEYKNEFNERENLYTRGLLLGKVFGNKIVGLGYKKIIIYVRGLNKGRSGVVRSLSKIGVKIYTIILVTCNPHNGCRPIKSRRKKFRSKSRGIK